MDFSAILIPKKPWNSISMDFIEKLPLSSSYTLILGVVDHLSKQSLFILTHDNITSPQLAQLFILHVFSKDGVPSHITSDPVWNLYPILPVPWNCIGHDSSIHFWISSPKVVDKLTN